MAHDAVIVNVVRTASGKGKPGGALSGVHPVDLLATVLRELVRRNGLDPAQVEDVIGGCVTQAGEQSLNITRNAVLAAGFPETVPATTVDRQCGSSQQAAAFAAQGVLAGSYDIVIAAGVESMSRAPMFSATGDKDPYGRSLAQRYPDGLITQGVSAEIIAARWKLDRQALDEFAARSHQLAAAATAAGGSPARSCRCRSRRPPVPAARTRSTRRSARRPPWRAWPGCVPPFRVTRRGSGSKRSTG